MSEACMQRRRIETRQFAQSGVGAAFRNAMDLAQDGVKVEAGKPSFAGRDVDIACEA
jgi:hypothetical protein